MLRLLCNVGNYNSIAQVILFDSIDIHVLPVFFVTIIIYSSILIKIYILIDYNNYMTINYILLLNEFKFKS